MKSKKKKQFLIFNNSTSLYTFAGVLFGLLFPLVSSPLENLFRYGEISFWQMIEIQKTTPLLWVIDSAPFFLGMFARFAGKRQDKLNKFYETLQEAHICIQAEVKKSKEIENELRKQSIIIQNDLDTAKVFQESFLPEIPDFSPLDIHYTYTPIRTVGGDFLSMNKKGDKSLSLFLGDVSGHGVSAALITTIALVIIHRLQEKHAYSPERFLSELNKELLKFIPNNRFITAIYGVFVKQHNSITFTYSRGGHTYPILWEKSKQKSEPIITPGTIIGALPEATFSRHSVTMKPGDRIFFYTDGVPEAINAQNQELGEEGILRVLDEVNLQPLSIKETVETVLKKFEDFSRDGGKEKDDKVFMGFEAI